MLLCAFLPAQWPPVLCWHLMIAYTVNIMLLLITFTSTVLCSWALTGLACHSTWVTSFLQHFYIYIHRSGFLTALTWLVPHETAAVSAHSVFTIQQCTMSLHAKPHICKVHACLAVTCHLHFWQNDQDLLCTPAVIRGGGGGGGGMDTKRFTLKKKILLPLQQGLKHMTFQSQVWHSNHWAISTP